MAVREFTASTDRVDCSGGAIGAYATGPFTLVVVCKPLTVASIQTGIISPRISGGAVLGLMYTNNGGLWGGGDAGDQAGVALDALTTEWQLFGYGKADGAAPIRAHRSPLSSPDWSHSTSAGNLDDVAGTCNLVRFASNDFGFDPQHRMAVAALYDYVLSDAEWEAMTTEASTAYLDSLGPVAGWEFNQPNTAVAISDWTGGGANQSAIDGSTVVTDDDPAWTFLPGSYAFDGSDDSLVYADAAPLDALDLTDYLVLAWVRPGSGGHNNGRIFGRAANSAGAVGHMQLMVGSGAVGTRDTNFTGRQLTSGTAALDVSAVGVVPNDAWSCIGFQYDEAVGTRIRLFDAGAETADDWGLTSPTGTIDTENDQAVAVGNEPAGARGYQGQIAYVGVWDTSTLTAGEVDTLVADFYNAGAGAVDVPRQDVLVEFLRLDEDGATDGDLAVLTSPTVTGAVFTPSLAAPVVYNALGGEPPAPSTKRALAPKTGARW